MKMESFEVKWYDILKNVCWKWSQLGIEIEWSLSPHEIYDIFIREKWRNEGKFEIERMKCLKYIVTTAARNISSQLSNWSERGIVLLIYRERLRNDDAINHGSQWYSRILKMYVYELENEMKLSDLLQPKREYQRNARNKNIEMWSDQCNEKWMMKREMTAPMRCVEMSVWAELALLLLIESSNEEYT